MYLTGVETTLFRKGINVRHGSTFHDIITLRVIGLGMLYRNRLLLFSAAVFGQYLDKHILSKIKAPSAIAS